MTWELLFDLFRTIAICSGALAAWKGLASWQQQMIGSSNYELAKRLLTRVFELQGIVRRIRTDLEDDESNWSRLLDVGAEIDTAFIEARVHWGDGIMKHKASLLKLARQLWLAKARLERANAGQVSDSHVVKTHNEFYPIR